MTAAWPDGVVVRSDEPLSRHVPLRIGGPCELFVVVNRREALHGALAACREAGHKTRPMGFGTRMLFRDGGVAGAVVRLGSDFREIEIDGTTVTAGAAVPVPALVAATASAGLAGLSELIRVPGSVGGLVCEQPDGPWCDRVSVVTALQRGSEVDLTLEEARRTRSVLTGVRFELSRGDAETLRYAIGAGLAGRRSDNLPPPGCWWQPLPKRPLRPTLVRAGLAGVRLRGMTIPQTAPETLANLGGGTARDLALLQKSAIDRVKRATGEVLASVVREVGSSNPVRAR